MDPEIWWQAADTTLVFLVHTMPCPRP